MSAPFLLFLASLAASVVALALPGLTDLILLMGPCALASLYLLLRAYLRGDRRARPSGQRTVIIDGSNVMHWKDGTPQMATLLEVVEHLLGLGITSGVVFDANAGHILTGRYRHHSDMARLLGLPEHRVMVVNKGTPADPAILAAARDLGARIVTNDRYRDWADAHPELAAPGYLIRGGYRAGKLWLDLDPNDTRRRPAQAAVTAA